MAFYFGILSDINSDVAVTTFILTIIFLAAFDFFLGAVEFSVRENPIYNQMLQKIYKELMSMGFVNFVVALFTATNKNDRISEWIDIIDFIGYLLFFVAIFFVLHAMYIMFVSYTMARTYAQRHSISLAETLQIYSKHSENPLLNLLFHLKYIPISSALQIVEFKIIYALFRDTYWLPPKFDYGMYLSGCLERYSLEVINIGSTSWVMMIMIALLNYIRLKFMGNDAFNCHGYHTDETKAGDAASQNNPYDTVSSRCETTHLQLFCLCGGLVCAYAFLLFVVSRFYVKRLVQRAGVCTTADYPEFLMFEESCNLSEHMGDSKRNIEIFLPQMSSRGNSRRRMSINTFRGQVESMRSAAEQEDDSVALYKTITRSMSDIHNNYFNFDFMHDLYIWLRLNITKWWSAEEGNEAPRESIIFRRMSKSAPVAPSSTQGQRVVATKRKRGGRRGSTTITLSGGPMADVQTTPQSSAKISPPSPSQVKPKTTPVTLSQMNPEQKASWTTIEQFKLKQQVNKREGKRRSTIGDYLDKGKMKLTEDFSDVYFFSSPLIYFRAVEIAILLNSLYLSVWAVNFISVVEEETKNPAFWQILMLVPLLVCLPLIGEVVKTASLLSAIAELELDVIGSVLESMEDEKLLLEELRGKIERRLMHVNVVAERQEIVHSLFSEIDRDRSGLISRFEFREMLRALHLHYSDKKFKKLFDVIDKDRSGSISEKELNEVLFPEDAMNSDVQARSEIVNRHMEVHKEKKRLESELKQKKLARGRWRALSRITSGVSQFKNVLKLRRGRTRRTVLLGNANQELVTSELMRINDANLSAQAGGNADDSDSSSSSSSSSSKPLSSDVKPFDESGHDNALSRPEMLNIETSHSRCEEKDEDEEEKRDHLNSSLSRFERSATSTIPYGDDYSAES